MYQRGKVILVIKVPPRNPCGAESLKAAPCTWQAADNGAVDVTAHRPRGRPTVTQYMASVPADAEADECAG